MRSMWIKILFGALAFVVITLFVVIFVNKRRLDRAHAQLKEDLLAARGSPVNANAVFSSKELAGLPAPVQRYLNKAIPEGQPYVRAVRLHQVGEFRLGDRTAPWKPLEAEQVFTVDPPGFVWDAQIDMAPLVSARVVDMYKEGQGALRAKVFSTLLVADAPSCPEIDSGELMRYLAESVWFPTALLPSQGVVWSPIDAHSARATLEHQGNRVSLVFTFNDEDDVARVHTESRYREIDGEYEATPWTGYFSNYQIRNGLCIPLDGEVMWNLPDGDLPYWRAHLDNIHYDMQ